MINQELERHFADCSELVEAWKNFKEYYALAMAADRQITPEAEQGFMDCKARIAMLHDSFIDGLKHDHNIGQNMLSIVNRSITLSHLRRLGTADQKKIEIEWHESYLLLNETVSEMAEEREELADINQISYQFGKLMESLKAKIRRFFTSPLFKAAAVVAIILGVSFLTPAPAWNFLRNVGFIKDPYGAFLDLKRELSQKAGFPLGGPYSSLARFEQTVLDNLPDGMDSRSPDEDITKEDAAARFSWLNVGDQQGDEFLGAGDVFFHTRIMEFDGGADVYLYAFYWFDQPGGADVFESYYNSSTQQDMKRGMTVFREENLIIVLVQGSEENRQRLKNHIQGI